MFFFFNPIEFRSPFLLLWVHIPNVQAFLMGTAAHIAYSFRCTREPTNWLRFCNRHTIWVFHFLHFGVVWKEAPCLSSRCRN